MAFQQYCDFWIGQSTGLIGDKPLLFDSKTVSVCGGWGGVGVAQVFKLGWNNIFLSPHFTSTQNIGIEVFQNMYGTFF